MEIITTHKTTDFDAFASTVAASMLYPEARAVLPNSINPNVKAFLTIHKYLFDIVHPGDVDFDAVDSLIVVDAHSWERLDRMDALRDKPGLKIRMYDHHEGPGTIEADWACCEPVGAAITLLIREMEARRTILTPIHATLFLAGLYEDTGHLTFPGTTSEDARAAAWLLDRKADLSVLSNLLRPAYGEKQKNVLFELLKEAERTQVNGYTISIARAAIQGHVGGLSMVVNMYREIVNVDAAFGIFSTDKGRCIVIGRSDGDIFDVGSVMRSMGGGGHPGAGSAQLRDVNPDAIEEWIVELIEGNQQSSVQISDIMSFPVFSVSPDTTMQELAELLRKKGCTGVPVTDNGDLVGIVSRSDFKKVRKESQLKSPVKAFMQKNIRTIEPGKSPMHAARIMVKHDIGRLPVVQDGKLIGIVTRSDAMMYFYDLLPD